MNTTAVIVARFQTPYLHEGHMQLLEEIKNHHHKVVVVLGVSPVKGSKRNPFDYYTRERLIKATYPSFIVLPLADHPSDKTWSLQLDQLLQASFPDEHFTLYGSRDSFIPFYSGKLSVKELPGHGDHTATNIRTEFADKVMDSGDFRMGINYAYHNTYTKVYPTVDIALFKEQRKYILLGQKVGRNAWRLPGGFIDVKDANAETAAKRELLEECGPIETGAMSYISSVQIDDWRYRKEGDKIMTFLFATDLVFGEPVGSDDLKEVKWFDVTSLEKMMEAGLIVEEHHPLVSILLEKLLAKETTFNTQSR